MPIAILPHDLDDVCRAVRDHPHHSVVAGGTDVMPRINEGAPAPAGWISLRRVSELGLCERTGGGWTIGAGTTFGRLARITSLGPLARAAQIVGSPQIRAAATLGGNLATASPAGDSLPALLCLEAMVVLRSVDDERTLPLASFLLGPGRTARRADELIVAVRVSTTEGADAFVKVGTRSTMTIATCSLAACLDPSTGVARVAIGAVAPTARRVEVAEPYLLDPGARDEFVDAVGDAAQPIDDHRATARYRRHALQVVAGRVHTRLWADVAA